MLKSVLAIPLIVADASRPPPEVTMVDASFDPLNPGSSLQVLHFSSLQFRKTGTEIDQFALAFLFPK
jgi:hypothetical protein